MCANPEAVESDLKSVNSVQNEGPSQTNAHATGNVNVNQVTAGNKEDVIIKKRKTRRGKSKRRNPNPYTKLSWQQRKNIYNRQGGPYSRNNKFRNRNSNMLNHALAPYNSNQFLMEDHGDLQELDDKLNKSDGAGTSTLNPSRTRDSSFSVDSDADFYSSPEDEEEFLTKEFDTAYENLQVERLQAMTKPELIEEYLQLESKLNLLTKRIRGKSSSSTPSVAATSTVSNEMEEEEENNIENTDNRFEQEINKLHMENDKLRRENEHLRNRVRRNTSSSFSSSMDSESDSSTSTCNSSSSSSTSSNQDSVMKDIVGNGVETSETQYDDNHKSPTTVVINGNNSTETSQPLNEQQSFI